MGYRYTEAVNALEAGDIDGVRRLYGGPLRASRDWKIRP
jgi:hypothetical protein